MAEGIRMRATAEREVRQARAMAYRWNSTLPDALHVFPMLSRCEQLSNRRFRLTLAELAVLSWKIAVVSVVDVHSEPERCIRFVSVPGQGNAEVAVQMLFSDTPSGGTRIVVGVEVRPNMAVPPLTPVALVRRTASATLSLAVQRMLRNIEVALHDLSPLPYDATAAASSR